MWIDTHCHLNDPAFREDYPMVIERAVQAGVEQLIVVGFDLDSSREAIRLARQFPMIYAAVGIHPHDAKTWDVAVSEELQRMLIEPKVVALGEIGLDYHYDYSPRDEQIKVFRTQLAMAKQFDKPVIIHMREACQETMNLLTEEQLGPAGGVMHCFTGSRETALQCLTLGLHLSFGGAVTFANAHKIREVVQGLPLEKMLVETDCPYLTPHPYRGKRNEPALVRLVGEKLAEIKGESITKVMETTTINAKRLFGIH